MFESKTGPGFDSKSPAHSKISEINIYDVRHSAKKVIIGTSYSYETETEKTCSQAIVCSYMKYADSRSPRLYISTCGRSKKGTQKYIVRIVRGYQQYIIKGPTNLSTLVLAVKIREEIKEKKINNK